MRYTQSACLVDTFMACIGTDNSLADTQGGYENITVARSMGVCDLDFLHFIHNSIQPGDTPADCILIIALSLSHVPYSSMQSLMLW